MEDKLAQYTGKPDDDLASSCPESLYVLCLPSPPEPEWRIDTETWQMRPGPSETSRWPVQFEGR